MLLESQSSIWAPNLKLPVDMATITRHFHTGLSPLSQKIVRATDMDPSFFSSNEGVVAMPFKPNLMAEVRLASLIAGSALCWAQDPPPASVQLVQCRCEVFSESALQSLTGNARTKCIISAKVTAVKAGFATVRFLVREAERNKPVAGGVCTYDIKLSP